MQYENEYIFDPIYTSAHSFQMDISSRLDKAMQDAGFESQSALSRASGVPQPTINRILKRVGTKGPEADTVRKLAAACNVSFDWLNEGIGVSARLPMPMGIVAASGGPADDLTIEISDASASMGLGIPMMDHEQTVATMKVSRSWVHSHLPKITSVSNLAILTAYGESMSPTFSDGDMLLVDRGITSVNRDAVYVIARNSELYVKRVHRRFTDGAVVIKSDNPLHGPDAIVENGDRERLEVLGLVVYAWNGRKL